MIFVGRGGLAPRELHRPGLDVTLFFLAAFLVVANVRIRVAAA